MSQSIQCPECHSSASKVIDSRWTGSLEISQKTGRARLNHKVARFVNAVRRRRECDNGHRFSTYEVIDSELASDRIAALEQFRGKIIEALEGSG